MSNVAAGRPSAAAVLVLLLSPQGAAAQQTAAPGAVEAPLDPSAPLAPLPDLGVDWPAMNDTAGDIATTPDTSISNAATERNYKIRIDGIDAIEADGLRARFDQLSTLREDKGDPANAAQIDRRAREDADLLTELLRSYGYYDAFVRTHTEAAEKADSALVVLEAAPGPLYHFTTVDLPGIEAAGPNEAALRQAFAVKGGEPVNAANVEAGEAALKTALGARGYAFADVGALDIAIDHEKRTAALALPVAPNGSRKFGHILVKGKTLFSARHIQLIARFQPGDPYRAPLIEDLRRALVATGLVSSVVIKPIDNPRTKEVDLAITLERAPVHTVAIAAGYGTGEGVKIDASWQHRNLIKPEGAVTFRGVAGTREQLLSATLRQNDFRERDEVLNAQVAASHVNQDAYDAKTFQVSAGIERQSNIIWQKKWTWSIGPELVASDERDVDIKSGTTRRRTFFIAAFPATLAYDGSNDLLDPTTGYRLSGRISPEVSLQNGVFGYTRAQIDGSFYQPVSDGTTIAGRVRFGTIFGASRNRIAPSRRFYAGGGGSVRGYGYQDLGPRDPVFNDPIGGRSLAEFALEARVRLKAFGGNFGIVPFIDAGNIYTSPIPHVGDLRYGAGLGIRYHTNFGPIRVDVGTPLNPEPGDARVAVYVSLGQAF